MICMVATRPSSPKSEATTPLGFFMITPMLLLVVLLAFTAVAAVAHFLLRQGHVEQLKALAAQQHMHFAADDRFRLAARVAPHIPIPGAAAVRVCDLVYGVAGSNYRYIFRTEYTIGVLRTKTSVRRVASFSEPRDGGNGVPKIIFAPEHLPLMEQYRQMLE